ncbi:hypothetical protein [uncultured Parolsenella sp.]|uniref:coiled-coil domain-containing protein n=1 Tax=uncultured Parolsenella sp. TaxID=2083008 RepID=UPI0027DD24D1|nr:hypothetical protein [uncultured Parolsenella sp.]
MTDRSGRAYARRAIMAGLAAALFCATTWAARPARAATVDELQAKVDQSVQAYDDATAEVNDLQAKIEDSQAKIDEVNAQLPQQRKLAEDSLRSLYKMHQGTPGLVSLLLSSDNFSDFLTTYHYIETVQNAQVDDVEKLAKMEGDLESAQQTLQASKTAADQKQQDAADAMAQAQSELDELNRQIEAQKAAEAAAAAKAAEEAAAQAAAQQQQEQEAAASAAAQTQAQTQAQANQSSSNPQPSNPSATDGSEVKDDGEWMIGSASAYSPESNTGGNATASGEILSESSVSVAVPASQRYLLGRTVQIRWNGKTVNAKVTDTGGFAAYGRVLDLAPGVYKAFGFSSASAWGVRVVQYRFL